MMDKKLKG